MKARKPFFDMDQAAHHDLAMKALLQEIEAGHIPLEVAGTPEAFLYVLRRLVVYIEFVEAQNHERPERRKKYSQTQKATMFVEFLTDLGMDPVEARREGAASFPGAKRASVARSDRKRNQK